MHLAPVRLMPLLCMCVYPFAHVPLCVCLCTLHAQVSVGLYHTVVFSASSQQVCKWFDTQDNDVGQGCRSCWHGGSLNGPYFALLGFMAVALSVCLKLCYIMTAVWWKRKLAARFRLFQHLPKEPERRYRFTSIFMKQSSPACLTFTQLPTDGLY